MNLHVTGLHMDVGESLKEHCQQAIAGIQDYFPDIVDAHVQVQNKTHHHVADVKIHASHIHLRAKGEGDNFYLAVDHALEKLVRQLDKYKGRLQKHRDRRGSDKFNASEKVRAVHNKLQEDALDAAPANLGTGYAPNVDRKVIKDIQTLTVDEAVMQMDLMHTAIFLFNNIETHSLNVVYREDDGSIGWVETDKLEKVAQAQAS